MAFLSPIGIATAYRQKVPKRARCITTASTNSSTRSDIALSRRALLRAGAGALAVLATAANAEEESETATATTTLSPSTANITDKVYLDVKVAGLPAGRLTVGLFGSDAPKSVEWFKTSISDGLRGKAGLRAGYKGSVGTRVSAGRFVELGRVKQIDAINQSPGTPQRQQRQILPPENRESNDFTHDARGLVSVKRGGGAFEFTVTLAPCAELDSGNIVIGRVLQGDEVLQKLNSVPTNRKTVRDGFRNVGRAIGDARAKVDNTILAAQLEEKPLQKIVIADCGIL